MTDIQFGPGFGMDDAAKFMKGIKPITKLSGEMTITYLNDKMIAECLGIPEHYIVKEQDEVCVIYHNRCWWKPWTWFKKNRKYKIPAGTIINLKMVDKETKNE